MNPPEGKKIIQYVVYCSPTDFPGKFAVRAWDAVGENGEPTPAPEVTVVSTLDEAREAIPPHLFRLPRMEGDDPCIVEVWI